MQSYVSPEMTLTEASHTFMQNLVKIKLILVGGHFWPSHILAVHGNITSDQSSYKKNRCQKQMCPNVAKGLDIVTNKVTQEERSLVKHHCIDFLHPLSHHNVVDFRNIALPIVEDLQFYLKGHRFFQH